MQIGNVAEQPDGQISENRLRLDSLIAAQEEFLARAAENPEIKSLFCFGKGHLMEQ